MLIFVFIIFLSCVGVFIWAMIVDVQSRKISKTEIANQAISLGIITDDKKKFKNEVRSSLVRPENYVVVSKQRLISSEHNVLAEVYRQLEGAAKTMREPCYYLVEDFEGNTIKVFVEEGFKRGREEE